MPSHVPTAVSQSLAELARDLRDQYGPRVCVIKLFGSFARGDATEDSDVDVLVVIRDLSNDELYDAVSRSAVIASTYNLPLRPLVMSLAEFEALRTGERLLYTEIDRDGVAL